MIPVSNMMIWNNLPALIAGHGQKKRIVVFSNVDGSFVLCEIPYDLINEKSIYEQVEKQGFFNCLKGVNEYLADELTVILSLSEKCNCRCRYCFLDAEKQGAVMTKELLHSAIDKACEIANGRYINFSAFGGEPTTEENMIAEMVEYTQKKYPLSKLKYSITTNGIFSDRICNLLINNNFSISLSMDGLPEVQNFQRPLANQKESYKYVEVNIRKLAISGCRLKIRCTVTKFSVNRMKDTVVWLHGLGVKRIHFEPVTPGGRGCTDEEELQPPTSEEFVNNLIKSIEEGAKYGMDIICFPYMNMMIAPIVFCDGRADNRIVVSPRGVVSSCVEVQSKEHELYPYLGLGEFDFENNAIKFSYDKRRDGIRGCHALTETKKICKTCPLKFFCGGGCPTRNYRGAGSTDVVDQYRCDIIRMVMPYILDKFYKNTVGGDFDE